MYILHNFKDNKLNMLLKYSSYLQYISSLSYIFRLCVINVKLDSPETITCMLSGNKPLTNYWRIRDPTIVCIQHYHIRWTRVQLTINFINYQFIIKLLVCGKTEMREREREWRKKRERRGERERREERIEKRKGEREKEYYTCYLIFSFKIWSPFNQFFNNLHVSISSSPV